MSALPKGGRGHKAPYDTCTIRIPVAIRDQVEQISIEYRQSVLDGVDYTPDRLPIFSEALSLIKKCFRQKRSGKYTIIKLLQLIYKVEVTEKDLS